jgi:uncharacterized protein (DUF1697 family)
MPTHLALLRGVNVGGGGKLEMAELRRVVSALGHRDVITYIQTGNLLFTPASQSPAAAGQLTGSPGTAERAEELEAAIADRLNVRTEVIVLTRDELAAAISANPYADEPEPRFVHCVFLPDDADEATHAAVRDAVAQAGSQGSRDEATIVGRVMYLRTPDGFGTSVLARWLLTRKSPVAAGTARNWRTVTKLLALCDE